MTVHSFWQQSLTSPAAQVRKLAALLWPGDDGVRSDSGSPLLVQQQAVADMSVKINSGWAKKSGYLAFSDALANVIIATANASNPRKDLIVMRWRDTEAGDASSSATIEVIAGTPAAVPSAPSTVGMIVQVLAEVFVAAGTTAILSGNITDKRTLVSQFPDTKNKTTGLPIVAAAGFSLTGYEYRIKDDVMYLTVVVKRTGADLTSSGTGNLTNVTFATLLGAFATSMDVFGNWVSSFTSGGYGYAADTGQMSIKDSNSNSSIFTNDTVSASFVYPLG